MKIKLKKLSQKDIEEKKANYDVFVEVKEKKIKVMIKFKDLKFEPRDFGGVGAKHTFDNGITISVQASQFNYSTPKEDLTSSDDFVSFEVAMWDEDGEWATKDLVPDHDDDVLGWQDRDEINTLMNKIQTK